MDGITFEILFAIQYFPERGRRRRRGERRRSFKMPLLSESERESRLPSDPMSIFNKPERKSLLGSDLNILFSSISPFLSPALGKDEGEFITITICLFEVNHKPVSCCRCFAFVKYCSPKHAPYAMSIIVFSGRRCWESCRVRGTHETNLTEKSRQYSVLERAGMICSPEESIC